MADDITKREEELRAKLEQRKNQTRSANKKPNSNTQVSTENARPEPKRAISSLRTRELADTYKGNANKKSSGVMARNLALQKNNDRNRSLSQKVRGRVGQTAGVAVGGYILPVVGATVGGTLGKWAGESKIGKWLMWAIIIIVILYFSLILIVLSTVLFETCKSTALKLLSGNLKILCATFQTK